MKERTRPSPAERSGLFRTVLLLAVFAGCSLSALLVPLPPAIAQKPPAELLVGVHRNFPPHYAIDEATGKPAGFAIDIMEAVAKRAGLKIGFVVFDDWPAINRALREGKIDIIPNHGITDERTEIAFTSPVETFNIRIFVRETTTEIRGIDDLAGRKVAVVESNKGRAIIEQFGSAKPVVFQSLDEALLSLLSGNSDALVYPEPPVWQVARRSKLADRIKTVGEPLLEVKRAIAVGKGRTDLLGQLDGALQGLVASPEYRRIYERWYAAPSPYWDARRVLIAAGILLLTLVALFAVWHDRSLARMNRRLGAAAAEQKRAAEALRESEQRYRNLLENMTEAVVVIQDGRVKFVNHAVAWIGYTPDEYGSLAIHETVHPEDRAAVERRYREKIDGSTTPTRHCYRVLAKGGRILWIDVSSVRIDWEGRPATLNLITDISDKKRLEEALEQGERRFSEFVQQSAEGICLFEMAHPPIDCALPVEAQVDLLFRDVVIRECNAIFAAAHGYGRPEEMAGFRIGQLFPRLAPQNVDYLRAFVENGYRLSGLETKELTRDGTIKYFLNTITGEVENGRLIRLFGAKQDITWQKGTEQVLVASREQMRALAARLEAVREEERTRIAREIHDELGGVLTGMKIDAALLARAALKVEGERARAPLLAGIDSMSAAADTAIQTVRRIAMALRPGVLDDLGLVAALEWQLREIAKRTGLCCNFVPPAEEPLLDRGLATGLFRICQEALTNVVRHAGASRVTVRLRADGESLLFEVEDDGKGIEKEKTLDPGSLGLLGMRERAELFGGRLTVAGTPGKGTKVTVERPPVEKRKGSRDRKGVAV